MFTAKVKEARKEIHVSKDNKVVLVLTIGENVKQAIADKYDLNYYHVEVEVEGTLFTKGQRLKDAVNPFNKTVYICEGYNCKGEMIYMSESSGWGDNWAHTTINFDKLEVI
jgi:hypothetical protein